MKMWWLLVFPLIAQAIPGEKEEEAKLRKKRADLQQAYLKLAKEPNEKNLKSYKELCERTNSIDFDGDSEVTEATMPFLKKPNIIMAKAWVYSVGHCVDGASSLGLQMWLGNEVLMNGAAILISAIASEKVVDKVYNLAEMENTEWLAVECEAKPCELERKKFFAAKRVALQKAKIKKSHEPIRQELLKNLKSDRMSVNFQD